MAPYILTVTTQSETSVSAAPKNISWPTATGLPLRRSNNGYKIEAGANPGTVILFRFNVRLGLYRVDESIGDDGRVDLDLIRALT
jgi:hypothetical protein